MLSFTENAFLQDIIQFENATFIGLKSIWTEVIYSENASKLPFSWDAVTLNCLRFSSDGLFNEFNGHLIA